MAAPLVISPAICLAVYFLICYAVASSLTLEELTAARDDSLAEAARPALGGYGAWFTVGIAMTATASGLLASIFAVSRMLAMLTEMKLIPQRHFGMPGDVQTDTVVIAALPAAVFGLSRIASLGTIYYLLMDIAVHWGVLRHLHRDVDANRAVLGTAVVLDIVALGAFSIVKSISDPASIVFLALLIVVACFVRPVVLRHVRTRTRRD